MTSATDPATTPAAPVRRRPPPGQRREQILHTLAAMLEQPGAERITTAALAARLQVSEAALYRHFASKAQMFEALIDFIEDAIFGLFAQIAQRQPDPLLQAQHMAATLLQFAEKNPGMVRVMTGEALVLENERLQERMALFFDKVEAHLRQSLRLACTAAGAASPTVDAQVRASALLALFAGRMQQYARSRFKRLPTEHMDAALALLLRP